MSNKLYAVMVVLGLVVMLALYLDGATRGSRVASDARSLGLASVALDVREIR